MKKEVKIAVEKVIATSAKYIQENYKDADIEDYLRFMKHWKEVNNDTL